MKQISYSAINQIRLAIGGAWAYPQVSVDIDSLVMTAQKDGWTLIVRFSQYEKEPRVFSTLEFGAKTFDPLNYLGDYANQVFEMSEDNLKLIGPSTWLTVIGGMKLRSRDKNAERTKVAKSLSDLP